MEIKAKVYYILRRCLSQQRRDAIKQWQISNRRQLAKLYSVMHGSYTAKELVAELKAKMPEKFDVLMVHSAYDRLLPMYVGNPQELVKELISFCGPERTLVMPAFCLGGRLRDKRTYYETRAFDVKRTASEMGLLTEIFR